MLNFSKIICTLSIYWTLSNPSVNGGLLDTVLNVVVPGGVDNVGENSELCGLNMTELVEYYGYESDTKSVTTDDGYILTVYCVYNSSARNPDLNPVIAWHGLMDASRTFCINYPDQSLAFLLADQGYYVCLPNARGNGFSQGYKNASRNADNIVDPYWKFSWDQIAEFDVPAVIDAVRDWTKKSKVIYIGHSQGTTTMFALLSSKPSYNDKISIFAALAPVTYFSHTTSPLYVYASQIEFLLDGLYGTEFIPQTALQGLLQFVVCTLPTEALCKSLLFLAFGYSTHIDESRLPAYMCYTPTDFSWGQFLHYTQLVKVDKFQKYDFGSRNKQIYRQTTPPQYNISQISAPVALFYSDADLTTVNVDVQKLKSQLRNVVYEQQLDASEDFNHLDYVWGKDVAQIVYAALLNLLKDY